MGLIDDCGGGESDVTRPPRPPQARSDGVQWDEDSEQPLLADSEETKPFDPLDTKNLAVAVAKALLERRARPLGALPLFRGAGIYAIYYCGDFQAYRLIAQENPDLWRNLEYQGARYLRPS